MKLYVECRKAKNSDSSYIALVVDMGYRKAILSFDKALISEITLIPLSVLSVMKVGDCTCVGDLLLKSE